MSELREILKKYFETKTEYPYFTTADEQAEQSIRSHFEAKVGECPIVLVNVSQTPDKEEISHVVLVSDIIARIWEEKK